MGAGPGPELEIRARHNFAMGVRQAISKSLLDHLRRIPVSYEIGEKLPGFEIDAPRTELRARRHIRRIHELRERPLRTVLLKVPFLRAVACATKFQLHLRLPPCRNQNRPQSFSCERGENCSFRTKKPDSSSVFSSDERSDRKKIYSYRVTSRNDANDAHEGHGVAQRNQSTNYF